MKRTEAQTLALACIAGEELDDLAFDAVEGSEGEERYNRYAHAIFRAALLKRRDVMENIHWLFGLRD